MDILHSVSSFGHYVPTCSKDNSYENVQCHPSTGYCWCVDQNGNEWRGTRGKGRPLCDHTGKLRYQIKCYTVLYFKFPLFSSQCLCTVTKLAFIQGDGKRALTSLQIQSLECTCS